MIDAKAIGSELAAVVKAQLNPILSRLENLEKRFETIPAPVDLSADLAALKAAVEAIERPTIPALPELPDIAALVDTAVAAAVAALPTPVDLSEELSGLKAVFDAIEPSITLLPQELPDIEAMIRTAVDAAVAAIPQPEKAIGLAGALIDRSGELVVTLSNGEVQRLGLVVGKDGDDGKPGRDGFNLENFDAKVMDDCRTVLLSFVGKDIDYSVELGFPVMLYRGVFTEGDYSKGDTVTWGGSLWHCEADKTEAKPGDGSKDWTLCAKKGRDGKDGVLKDAKPQQPVRVGVPAKGE